MAVRIRLRRIGAKKKPFYRVVVADSRSPRDGRFLDTLGWYDPLSDPVRIEIDGEKALRWLADGAEPTDSARSVLSQAGVWGRPAPGAVPGPGPPLEEPVVREPVPEEPVEEAPAVEEGPAVEEAPTEAGGASEEA